MTRKRFRRVKLHSKYCNVQVDSTRTVRLRVRYAVRFNIMVLLIILNLKKCRKLFSRSATDRTNTI